MRFLGHTGAVCSRRPTYLDSAWCLMRIALKLIRFRKATFIGLKSGAVKLIEGSQNKPATGAFLKPARPTPNARGLVLSMILEK